MRKSAPIPRDRIARRIRSTVQCRWRRKRPEFSVADAGWDIARSAYTAELFRVDMQMQVIDAVRLRRRDRSVWAWACRFDRFASCCTQPGFPFTIFDAITGHRGNPENCMVTTRHNMILKTKKITVHDNHDNHMIITWFCKPDTNRKLK